MVNKQQAGVRKLAPSELGDTEPRLAIYSGPWVPQPLGLDSEQTARLYSLLGASQSVMDSSHWIRIKNTETNDEYLICLYRESDTTPYEAVSLVRPFMQGAPLTSRTLREMPLTTIVRETGESEKLIVNYARQIKKHFLKSQHSTLAKASEELSQIAISESKRLLSDSALQPLPATNINNQDFLRSVALQYTTLKYKYPEENPVERMMKINKVKRGTVQRWLAYTRKANLLPPVPRGGR